MAGETAERIDEQKHKVSFWLHSIHSAVYAAARYVTTAIRVEEAELLLRETRERCEALEQSNAALRERIERSGDADRIAELARERLGLVLPDDRIYQ